MAWDFDEVESVLKFESTSGRGGSFWKKYYFQFHNFQFPTRIRKLDPETFIIKTFSGLDFESTKLGHFDKLKTCALIGQG